MLLPKLLPPDTATAHLRRLKPTPDQLHEFRTHLAEMLRHLDPQKIERHGETHILDFLRLVSRAPDGGSRYGNVHGKRDLVLHLGDTAATPVGVVLEVKGPQNSKEMLAPTDLNRKAFHQLLLYYLEDRTDDKADDFRRLIITTGYEWYVFDAVDFNRLFWKDGALVKAFREWKAGAKAATDTDFFYKSIASRKLAALEGELRVAYVDLRLGVPTKPAELLHLYRLFHPSYLLKEPLTGRRDPNTLNQEFYNELLYLMGLKEDKGGVRRIERCPSPERQPGSLLENTIRKLETGHGLNYLPETERQGFGDAPETQREGVALALCLMWVNRLLFLKLLEGQLVRYHPAEHAAQFRFLHPGKLSEYDDVQSLFFEVLNRPADQRSPDVVLEFPQVPYLNSSLFEPSPLEALTVDISGLRDGLGLAPFGHSVLRKAGAPVVPPGRGHTSAAPQWAALPYLLHFLDAYDFATDPSTAPAGPGAVGAPETPRPLLSAAVLGLVFEKINGYKDGSFYTPGFVTMYMARQTLGRAVVRHFARAAAFPELAACETLDDLQDALGAARRTQRPAYAAHFNTLTVLDPAVGSGHFLVSALNELLALKSTLGLLLDDDGARLPYTLEVEHDELLITDADGLPAPYRVGSYDAATGRRTVGPERTRLQRALFREKRALMEHALFGVDLNPNSVRICRLRLWIELLKHAYYKPETDFRELETLPNLDLNVKTGNSLLARFPLEADLSDVFRQGGFTLRKYRAAVHDYFNSRGRDEKNTLLDFFQQLKQQFTAVLHKRDPKREKLRLARNQRIVLDTQVSLIPETARQRETREFDMRRLELLATQLDTEIQAYEQGALFRDAFEWRFEFPEVLDETGAFRGFDVVLGNPPYGQIPGTAKKVIRQKFSSAEANFDLYSAFVDLCNQLTITGGEYALIVPVSWLTGEKFRPLRQQIKLHAVLHQALVLPYGVFAEAFVDTGIFHFIKQDTQPKNGKTQAYRFPPKATVTERLLDNIPLNYLPNDFWHDKPDLTITLDEEVGDLKKQMLLKGPLLSTISNSVRGIRATEADVFEQEAPGLVRFFSGDVKRYAIKPTFKWLNYGEHLPEKPKSAEVFKSRRILVRRLISRQFRIMAMVVEEDFVNKKDLYVVKLINTDFNELYVLGILNSSLVSQLITGGSTTAVKNDFSQVNLSDLRNVPIPAATAEEQAAIAALVQQVLAAKAANPAADTLALEARIDAAVATLYGVALPTGP